MKFTWKGGPGESLAFLKEVKKDSKGIAVNVETKMLAGEEIAFIPDTTAGNSHWNAMRIAVGYLGQ